MGCAKSVSDTKLDKKVTNLSRGKKISFQKRDDIPSVSYLKALINSDSGSLLNVLSNKYTET
jgi:hypothetical protein